VPAGRASPFGSPLVATDGVLLSLEGWVGVESSEADCRRAWVRAGTILHDLGPRLHELGMAMENLGDVDVQALGGALATGTHGTGRSLGSLSSRVSGVRLVLADGSIRVVTAEEDPDLLLAARVSLGALGVISAARLDLVEPYRLHERVARMPLEACMEELDAEIDRHRHFEFFWYPGRDLAEVKSLDPTEATPDAGAGRDGERIDWSFRILPSLREMRFFEMEYALPAEAGRPCFLELRQRIRTRHGELLWPIEYRTLRAEEAWLAPAHGRETVTLSVHQDGRLPYLELFADLEPILRAHGGRPHWGKFHSLGNDALRDLYPRFDDFCALRSKLDPEGRFLNEHLRSIFG
jgi:FAD/FMN-containing dehydrogenase